MPIVVIKATGKYSQFGSFTYTITEQDYEYSCFFTRYEHKPKSTLKAEEVTIYRDYDKGNGKKSVFANLGTYVTAVLDKVHVYYNKKDKTRDKPLILVLFFKDSAEAKNRYYVRSKFEREIGFDRFRYLGQLDEYKGDENLLSFLLEENGNIPDTLVYEVDNIIVGNYYNGKINVDKEENNPTVGFTKYTHKPTSLIGKSECCLLYNKKILLRKDIGRNTFISAIKDVQNIVINTISVYFSNKNKEPLMLYLHKENDGKQEHVYYFPKIHGILYWQILDTASYSKLLGQTVNQNQIHAKLNEQKSTVLPEALKKIQSHLKKLLIIMLDCKKDYLESDVILPLKAAEFNTHDYMFANSSGKIAVKDFSSRFQFPSDNSYKVYEHDLTDVSKSIGPNESVEIRFVLSEPERNPKDVDVLTVNLDYQYDSGGYYYKTRYISVANVQSIKHKYKWYNHNCEKNVIDPTFKLRFNGQYVTVETDLSDEYINHKVVYVYFDYYYRDSFILVAFPDPGFTKIRYLTYGNFMENILNGTPIQISKLDIMKANIKPTVVPEEYGYKIDTMLLAELNKQKLQIQSETSSSINSLEYQKTNVKFYVYTSADDSKILMICYADKAYTRYFLGTISSRWIPVDGVTSCLCKKVIGSQESSDKKLLESLKRISTLQGLIVPEKTTKEVELEKPITIDISILGPSSYDGRTVTVTKQTYENCNLFANYTHTPNSGKPFIITSLKASNIENRTITLKNQVSDVKSVDVYFNEFVSDKPLVLCIRTDNGACKYYKDLIKTSHKIIEDPQITSDNLFDKLMEQNEIVNSRFVFQIEKTFGSSKTLNYGYNNVITVTKNENNDHGFTIYTHTPKSKTNKADFLFENKVFLGRYERNVENVKNIYGENYNYIKVYFFNNDEKLPLVIELNHLKNVVTYHSHKSDENGLYWKEGTLDLKDDQKIKSRLSEIFYFLKSSIIIEIDKEIGSKRKSDSSYPIKLIGNKLNSLGQTVETNYIQGTALKSKSKITIPTQSYLYDASKRVNTEYKYLKHEIKDSGLTSDDKKDIAGFRFFIRQIGLSYPVELKLYNPNNGKTLKETDRFYLYYTFRTRQEIKIYVYYYGEDARPLLICYNNQLYKRFGSLDTEWTFVKGGRCHEAGQVLGTIMSIYSSMKKKLIFVKQGTDQNIIPREQSILKSVGGFKKEIYILDTSKSSSGPYKLTVATLTKGMKNITMLNKTFDTFDNQSFDSITKYYKDKTNPLLLEFVIDGSKICLVRKDTLKYWLRENIENPETELQNIDSNLYQRTVYELDCTSTNYNDNIISKPQNGYPTIGFNKYVHIPRQKAWKKSLFLYKGSKLLKKGTKGDIEDYNEINEDSYSNVNVYFGTQVKCLKEVPLIFELIKSTPASESYYSHRIKGSSSYWETISIKSKDEKDKELITKLRETQLELLESIVILLGKTDGETYGIPEIENTIKQLNTPKEFKLALKHSSSVRVTKVLDQAKDIGKYGFKVFEHNLSTCLKDGDNYGLTFFILSSNSADKYNEIKLYDSDDYMDALYYHKDNRNGKDRVYIYFFGDQDLRPLLVCYNGISFRPNAKESYFEKWYRDGNINKCVCDDDSDNQDLIKALNEVVRMLNVVQLEERPSISNPKDEEPECKGKTEHKYCIQKFKGKEIDISVSYLNKKCYRVYTHQHFGRLGRGERYRLGNITYETSSLDDIGLNYKSLYPLVAVSVYYSVHDGQHKHPFLVVLEFNVNTNNKEYYKLKQKNVKKWEKMKDDGDHSGILKKLKDPSTFENGLYDLRNKLDIEFKDEKNKITPLFKTDQCTEDNLDIPAIAGGTVGTAAVVGTGITIGVVVAKKLAAAAFVAAVS